MDECIDLYICMYLCYIHTDVSYKYKYLDVYVDVALLWSAYIDYLCSKVQQCIYFLKRIRSFGANKQILSRL